MLSIRILKCSNLLKCKNRANILFLNSDYALSTQTQPAVQTAQDYEKQLKDFETLTTVTKKIRPKKPQKPPFAKNLFLGVFDTDILAYPELEKEDFENLEPAVASVQNLLKQEHMVNCNTLSNKSFRQNLFDYKAIGLQAPQLMDGRECSVSETHRFLEVFSFHKLRDNLIYNELGAQILVKYGSDKLKKKYLHEIMKGNRFCAFCMYESDLSDFSSIKTRATLSEDKKSWILNGDKAWVVNGITGDTLFVAAVTDVVKKGLVEEQKLSIFIIDRDSLGISHREIKAGDLEMAYINFDDTIVPAENIIGEVSKAEIILAPILIDFRLSFGSACISLTKKIMNDLGLNILDQSNDSNMLYMTDAVREKIGEFVTNLYAMESVLYLTTGLLDTYENQDCDLESTIVKIFCSQTCLNASLTAIDLVGAPAVSESHWANQYNKEALRYLSLHETNSSLRIMVALLGLQYAGIKLNNKINKIRNPFFHAGFALKRVWTQQRHIDDNPKLDLHLEQYLHPSLISGSKHLEYSVKRLEFGTEVLLTKYGSDIIDKHMELARLGDCIIDIYLMTACLARASRSYCIGLQHGDFEMLTANNFCSGAMERVKANVFKMYRGEAVTHDENYRAIAKQFFKSKGYFFKHPLTRNF